MKHLKSWLPVAVWAALIFLLSGIPSLKSGFACDFLLRKAAHVTEYFILTFFLYRAAARTFRFRGVFLSLTPAAFVLLYAASDEFHQLFVAGRHGTVRDVLIDLSGAILFLLAFHLALRIPKLGAVLSRYTAS